ncbi:unnamed protein product [Schistocephalus solidus]|uniref:Carbonic anhydrase n=1 Tax=Schistocephalus solidus TaxID=70667 RepID=A0A183T315_SCHSO|nr:unnamed protein product [Schistocephalus solidus]
MACYKVNITALSAAQFYKQGQHEEGGADYNVFCCGQPKAERSNIVVTFAIRNDIVRCLPCMPHGINDRPMSLRLLLQ